MKHTWLLLWSLTLLAARAVAPAGEPPRKIYLAPDDHTDYFWTADDATYRKVFLETLDYYLEQMDQTWNAPSDQQARWNCDGSLWLWEYEKNKPAADFDRLIGRISDGHVSAPITTLVSTYGAQPAEAVLRGLYYSGTLERRFKIRFPLAVAMENQTLPLGLGALWAGSGAKYSWRGVCSCASKLPPAALSRRDREIYWWTGLDGSRVLMKWHSCRGNDSLGGYAEARKPREAINFVLGDREFQERYPFGVIGIFGVGHDDLKTLSDAFPRIASELSQPGATVAVSNEEDFFRDFAARHGSKLPGESLAYGNEWDLLCASMAEQTARVRRAVESLRAAEALATLVAIGKPEFWSDRRTARQLAHRNLGLYWEHAWTGDTTPAMRAKRAVWQRRLADDISRYVNELHESARLSLGSLIETPKNVRRFFVFNPLGWPRTDVADLALDDATLQPLHVVDMATGMPVFSQIVVSDRRRFLRVLAREVPSLGYRVYEVRGGAGQEEQAAARRDGATLENDRLRVTATATGAISSLFDKAAHRELAGARRLNVLSGPPVAGAESRIELENSGPVSTTLRIRSAAPLEHTTRLTLARGADWVEMENVIEANFTDVRTWGFDFRMTEPDVWHEEVGAVLRARQATAGGHYAGRNARVDWLSLGHFAQMIGREAGVTLANADCAFFRLGESRVTWLDTSLPRLAVLAGGQVDGPTLGIPGQDGDHRFTQRFAVRPGPAKLDPLAAMQWSLQWQNPLVAGPVTGAAARTAYPADMFSLWQNSDPHIVLWALKPAEEGLAAGVIARAWNLSREPASTRWTMPGLQAARAATHIETDEAPLAVRDQAVAIDFAPQQMRTARLLLGKSVLREPARAIQPRQTHRL